MTEMTMRDYTGFKQGFIFCLILGLTVWGMGYGLGCGGMQTVSSEKTVFAPATTVPSVTPPIAAATKDEGVVMGGLAQISDGVNGLTPTNVPTQKPIITKSVSDTITASNHLSDDLATARAAAAAADIAVASLTGDVKTARDLVAQREAELASQQAAYEKKLSAANASTQRLIDIFMLGVVGLGGLLLIGGILLFALAKNVEGGAIVGGSGLLIVGMGFAGLYFGWWFGLVGLILFVVGIIFAIWAGIHFTKVDGKSIIQTIQQAKISGVIPETSWETLGPMLTSALTPGAKAMVTAEVK